MAMELLNCYCKEMNLPAVKNCSEFGKANSSSFQDCVAEYGKDVFDNFMLFFGQIEPICQFYNTSTPELNAATIITVFFPHELIVLFFFVKGYHRNIQRRMAIL